MARNLSTRVLVEHTTYGTRKEVLRSKLDQLGPRWKRVSPGSKKTSPEPTGDQPSAPPAVEPDATTTTKTKE